MLVLSTGAAPVIPPIPGAGLPAVRVLRTVPDVDVLREPWWTAAPAGQ